MLKRAPIAVLAAAALLGVAAQAQGATVYQVKGDRLVRTNDPSLPAGDGLPSPAGRCTPPATSALPASAHVAAAKTVRGAVRQAFLDGRITREQNDQWRHDYMDARSARKRLSGLRRNELGAVISTLERIAARGQLTSGRMPVLFLQLEHNTDFWSHKPIPPVGVIHPDPCAPFFVKKSAPTRISFPGSQLIWQWYPGNGLQIQPLANFGKANGMWTACDGPPNPKHPCESDKLRQLLDELVAIGARRGDFTAWEYYFPFSGGSPPWISGLTTGTAIQALARGTKLFGDPKYLNTARDAIGAFDTGPPTGVLREVNGGSRYLEYSFAPSLFIVNGFLQSLIGLHDYAEIAQDKHAQALYERGERVAEQDVPRADTGAWSLYSLGGAESDLNYHRLLRDFLNVMCTQTEKSVYCDTAKRFTQDMVTHPKLSFAGPAVAHRGRRTAVSFTLDKISCVQVRITRGGETAFFKRTSYGHGRRAVIWVPRAAGRYTVKLEAADLRNHHTLASGTISVRSR
jgi:D-glucuronyl C5-epimerase C-terminus